MVKRATFGPISSERRRSGFKGCASAVSFNQDGIEFARVRQQRRWLPIWHAMVFIYLVLLIRLVALAHIGPAGYATRMEEMREGSALEQAAVVVMRMDPLSRRLAHEISGALDWFENL